MSIIHIFIFSKALQNIIVERIHEVIICHLVVDLMVERRKNKVDIWRGKHVDVRRHIYVLLLACSLWRSKKVSQPDNRITRKIDRETEHFAFRITVALLCELVLECRKHDNAVDICWEKPIYSTSHVTRHNLSNCEETLEE